MDEKELIELSDEIVHALMKLSMGEKPGFLAGGVYKKLPNHPRFEEIKHCYCEHLKQFKGAYDNSVELKTLTDFRFKIVDLYTA
ncbi:MAG: hypothetical protein EBQ94_05320 [Flavobacteriales bacterium]|jgi:hypothetical protein|nr:hypothetical protein [Crocinitomicaceae bacterium]NBX79790.1 hypothetical protein [Flavobacteriales bacterium]NCA21968.1 hypothetical protein [Crocinitomicaceae bacterium]